MVDTKSNIKDSLLHATDLHFWEVVYNPFRMLNKRFIGNANVWLKRRHAYHTHNAETFAEKLCTVGPKTILLSGDFTSTATENEYEQAIKFVHLLQDGGLNVIAIPGNHDVYTFESLRARRFEQFFETLCPANTLPCRITLPGGTPLVFLPTVCPNFISSRGRITQKEIETGAALVADAPDGPVLVCAHYPVLNMTPSYHTKRGRSLRGAESLRKALGETNRRILYVAGHVHRFSFVQDQHWEGLQHLSTGALFYHHRGGGAYAGFSEINVSHDEYNIYRHSYGDNWDCQPLLCTPEYATKG